MNANPYTLPAINRRRFIGSALALGAAVTSKVLPGAPTPLPEVLGPILGHTEPTAAHLWLRPSSTGEYMLEIEPLAGGRAITVPGEAREADDLCIHWRVDGLQAATPYRYRIRSGDRVLAGDPGQVFTTPPPPDAPSRVRFAISSCAKEDAGSRAVWKRMAEEEVDGVVLIGDTPYIDSTELEVQTRRHREFAAVPEYQQLLCSRSCWWTWDDHDFGINNCSGLIPGKENSRLVYTRYRPQASYGDGNNGIYTRFRYGPVEVFLLDTRWFAMTEASYARSGYPTLLGASQWAWLKRGLLESDAPFKLLACGMIWDDKEVTNTQNDSWGAYRHERKALEQFIAEHRIPGVVLVGGDIHSSRVLRYATKESIGYNLLQFIASPIHASVIPRLNVYNPDLVRSAVEPNVFLLLEADTTVPQPRLSGTLINVRGERVFSYEAGLLDLMPA